MPYADVLHTNKSCREVRFRSSSGESGEFESRISMRSSHLLNIQLLLTHLSSQCCHCIPLYLLPVIQCLNKKLSLIMAMCYRGHDGMMGCRYFSQYLYSDIHFWCFPKHMLQTICKTVAAYWFIAQHSTTSKGHKGYAHTRHRVYDCMRHSGHDHVRHKRL